MDRYKAIDITNKAREAADGYPLPDDMETAYHMPKTGRRPEKLSGEFIDGKIKIKILGLDGFVINHETVSLRYLEQIVDSGQNAGLSRALILAGKQLIDGQRTMTEIVDSLMMQLDKDGPDMLFDGRTPEAGLTVPRRQEVFACLNRFRSLRIS